MCNGSNLPDSPMRPDNVNKSLAIGLKEMERMELIGQVMIKGNIPCLTCGVGDECQMSGLRKRYGPDARSSDYPYTRVRIRKKYGNKQYESVV